MLPKNGRKYLLSCSILIKYPSPPLDDAHLWLLNRPSISQKRYQLKQNDKFILLVSHMCAGNFCLFKPSSLRSKFIRLEWRCKLIHYAMMCFLFSCEFSSNKSKYRRRRQASIIMQRVNFHDIHTQLALVSEKPSLPRCATTRYAERRQLFFSLMQSSSSIFNWIEIPKNGSTSTSLGSFADQPMRRESDTSIANGMACDRPEMEICYVVSPPPIEAKADQSPRFSSEAFGKFIQCFWLGFEWMSRRRVQREGKERELIE